MDFFEALWEKASLRLRWEDAHCGDGITATIEALKEMTVGEKKMFRISHHTKPDGEEWTFVRYFSSEHISLDGHQGTDGEEVVVMVFKKP